jgi:hypothetical protein
VGEEDVLHELLGERAAPLGHLAAPHVDHQGAGDAGGGDARVPVEVGVLGREHRLDHVLGELAHPHGPLFARLLAIEGGENGGGEGGALDRPAVQKDS